MLKGDNRQRQQADHRVKINVVAPRCFSKAPVLIAFLHAVTLMLTTIMAPLII